MTDHPVAYSEGSTIGYGEPLRKHTLTARFETAEMHQRKSEPGGLHLRVLAA